MTLPRSRVDPVASEIAVPLEPSTFCVLYHWYATVTFESLPLVRSAKFSGVKVTWSPTLAVWSVKPFPTVTILEALTLVPSPLVRVTVSKVVPALTALNAPLLSIVPTSGLLEAHVMVPVAFDGLVVSANR